MPFPAAEIIELQDFPTEILPELSIALLTDFDPNKTARSSIYALLFV